MLNDDLILCNEHLRRKAKERATFTTVASNWNGLFFATFRIHSSEACIFYVLQVVQEYERSVIFRLGRLRKGGAKGPGIFFIIPCIDTYRKVDLRTVSFDVPPQEVSLATKSLAAARRLFTT